MADLAESYFYSPGVYVEIPKLSSNFFTAGSQIEYIELLISPVTELQRRNV